MKKSGNATRVTAGRCFVFFRDGHDWHGDTVAVLSVNGQRCKVARATDVCEGLLASRDSKKRKLRTWSCTQEELW
jgi:hypothetical protein